jgi:hypothetical protein
LKRLNLIDEDQSLSIGASEKEIKAIEELTKTN